MFISNGRFSGLWREIHDHINEQEKTMRPVLAYKLIFFLRMIAEENKTQREVERSRMD